MLDYVQTNRKIASHYSSSLNTLQLADAGIQKAIYCLNSTEGDGCGGTFGDDYIGEKDVMLDNGQLDIAVIEFSDEERDVAVKAVGPDGQSTMIIVRLARDYPADELTQFPYAITSSNKTKIKDEAVVANGPVYTNSDIDCKKGAIIEYDAYSSLPDGVIDDCVVLGGAHAARIKKSDVTGGCYYDTEIHDTECGSEYPGQTPPPPVTMPEFDAKLWRNEASKGGTINDDLVIKEDTTLGPVKIDGKLKIEKDVNIVLAGPIWVTETIEIKDRATLTIHKDLGQLSSIILGDGTEDTDEDWGEDWPESEDDWSGGSGRSGKSGCKGSGASGGRIKIGKEVQFRGTGEAGSYIWLVSTSSKSPAIEAKQGSNGAIYLAANGSVKLKDRAAAVAVAAKCTEVGKEGLIGYDAAGMPGQIRTVRYYEDGPYWTVEPGTWREL